MPATLNTSFASDYVAQCYPPEPFAISACKKGRACLRLIGVTGVGDDLAFAAYLVWSRLSEFKNRGYDFVSDDYEVVGEVSDLVTDHDAELLAQAEPAVRKRMTGAAGGMSVEVTAVHDLLLEMSAALARRWEESA